MDYKAKCVTAIVAVVGWMATMLIAACSVEVPKSALPFRLTPPADVSSPLKSDTHKPREMTAP
jgi:hypothetical protein